tara:strand:- start:95 stop:385 length:291 start_codon:yes stop_codon:yes gene_type:complete
MKIKLRASEKWLASYLIYEGINDWENQTSHLYWNGFQRRKLNREWQKLLNKFRSKKQKSEFMRFLRYHSKLSLKDYLDDEMIKDFENYKKEIENEK